MKYLNTLCNLYMKISALSLTHFVPSILSKYRNKIVDSRLIQVRVFSITFTLVSHTGSGPVCETRVVKTELTCGLVL